jgi:hypothetical protein
VAQPRKRSRHGQGAFRVQRWWRAGNSRHPKRIYRHRFCGLAMTTSMYALVTTALLGAEGPVEAGRTAAVRDARCLLAEVEEDLTFT